MKLFIFSFLIFYSVNVFSQQNEANNISREQAQFLKANSIKNNNYIVKTISINLIGVNKELQGSLKDDFLEYDKKVISLDFNELDEYFIIKYTGLSDDKIFSLLNKYGISNSVITFNK